MGDCRGVAVNAIHRFAGHKNLFEAGSRAGEHQRVEQLVSGNPQQRGCVGVKRHKVSPVAHFNRAQGQGSGGPPTAQSGFQQGAGRTGLCAGLRRHIALAPRQAL